MGEAKRRADELRAALLREADRWDFPPSDWERETVTELDALPRVTSVRAPAEQLKWARMKARECHANAGWYADNDPNGEWKHVVGWWPQGDIFILHSVVRRAGDLLCVTPQEWDVPERFPFIPDEQIEARDEEDRRAFYRRGHKLPVGLRRDPAAQIEAMNLMGSRLASGVKPRQAMELADREATVRLGLCDYRLSGATAA